ncbi:hypothetical protein DFR30_1903 [Thiogranum longum]|uniref:Uncharacterized protein n=1 Tax=Thiogranum longum TaxID=1537524 RepID=A0A4R1H9P4_9GAMM|nr:hypothetical protein [Thiogranum longum]TCK18624.1 hypothetical protein DFR30_1903 [Thiogranum longum]
MKTTLSDLVIALLDLLEAEGRALRSSTLRVGLGLGLLVIAVGMLMVSAAFLLWSAYQFVSLWLEPALAALAMSLLALLIALLIVYLVKWLNR